MFAKSLVATAAAGCVTGVIWLTWAAVRGNDLGGPTGVLVGMALVLVTGLVLARRGDPLESWLWRHSRSATDEFVVGRSVADVVDTAAALAWRKRGWRPTIRDGEAGRAVLTTGMTVFSWKKRIEIEAKPNGEGSTVTLTSASPQLYDWGENRRVVAAIRQELERH